MAKKRLDQLVVDLGLLPSREKAKAVIMAGEVYVNGQRELKPGTAVAEEAEVIVRGATLRYVSRGGLKLEKAIKEFQINPENYDCIDCGASTGGFTDCLLQNGARHVWAVDVGYGQLAWSLRNDERVTVRERTNARSITPDMFETKMDLAVMDLSFISLKLVLPAVREVLKPEGRVVCLVKPQFEAGKEKVGKKGVVRDKNVHREVLENFLLDAEKCGFSVENLAFSPIRGPEGNIEYLAYLSRNGQKKDFDCALLVEQSHGELDK